MLSITCLLTVNYCSSCLIKRQKLTFSALCVRVSVLVHAEFAPEQVNLASRVIFVVELMTPTSQILLDHALFKK